MLDISNSTWSVTSFESNTMNVKINFPDPLLVSASSVSYLNNFVEL